MSADSFIEGIQSYDIHTYWNNNNKEEREAALLLRENVLKVFAKEIEAGDLRVHKPWDTPIGPHPISMWELDFKSPAIFSRIVPFFQVHHHKLLVLIHPRTQKGDLLDHTEHALWLGHKVRLDTTLLK